MRTNNDKTKTLRRAYRWRYLLDIVLHPLLMPTYVVVTFFALLFPYTIHNRQTQLLLGLYFFASFVAPLALCAIAMKRHNMHSLWRPDNNEGSLAIMLFCLIFYVSSLLLYRHFFFLPFMMAPIVVAIVLVLCRIATMSRQPVDMHTAALSAALAYIYVLCFRYGLPLSPTVVVLVLLSGILAYTSIETHRATPRSLLAGALLGLAAGAGCSAIFH